MKVVFALMVLTLALLGNAEKVKYEGYKVMRMTPHTEEQLNTLRQLEATGVSFWEEPSKIGRKADIMFPPHLQHLINSIQDSGIQVDDFIDNVQPLIDITERKMATRGARLTWDNYYTLDEIYTFLNEQAVAHDDVTVFSIGQTFEGRELQVLKISRPGGPRPIVWIDANIHAREWITSAVATYLVNEILNGEDAEVSKWADDFDFHFLVVTNPDGFVYSHNSDRWWRKTRSNVTGSSCRGADMNRNFGFHWFEGGSSSNPCSDIFAGTEAFSEIESQHIKTYYDSIASQTVFYLSLHSYGELILLPYGYTNAGYPPQYEAWMNLAEQAAGKHAERYGTQFSWGNVIDILYECSGQTLDYIAGVHNTSLVLTYELRDSGDYGFSLPPDQIVPSSLELIDGLHVYFDALRSGAI